MRTGARALSLERGSLLYIILRTKGGGARTQLWEETIEQLRKFDVESSAAETVTHLDRLARSTRDLLEIAERIKETGAGLRSLAEPWADTTTPAGRMVLTVFAGIADFERSLIGGIRCCQCIFSLFNGLTHVFPLQQRHLVVVGVASAVSAFSIRANRPVRRPRPRAPLPYC